MNKVLVLSPHFDDGIIGAGGTISRFLEEGKEVWYIIFSWQDQGANMQEIENSVFALGIKRDHLIIWDYPVRHFAEKGQEILEDMLKLRTTIAPTLVLCHRGDDRHQDHRVVSEGAFRAFRNVSIWGYRLPWNVRDHEKYVWFYKRNLDNKISALNCLESQRGLHSYYSPKKREANAIATGEEIKQDYAEKFENISDII